MKLEEIYELTPIGSIDKAIGNNIVGINHHPNNIVVPSNKDMNGFVFFTRPQLNLTSDNIRNYRKFTPLISDNELSMQRVIRCLLDPRLMNGYGKGSKPLKTPLVDNSQAFIPICTNNLTTMSGWPDQVSPTFDSPEGLYGEVYSQVDGNNEVFGTFDLDATFRNTKGDPIPYLFHVWQTYQSLVFSGELMPYPDMIVENEIDYNTRIYRIPLGPDNQTVKKIAATGASFPVSDPLGMFFDYNNEKPYTDTKQFTIRFKSLGAQYNDDILIHEFNETVKIFNPGMRDNHRDSLMMRIPTEVLTLFHHRGYPRIDPDRYKLEWWISKDFYDKKIKSVMEGVYGNN